MDYIRSYATRCSGAHAPLSMAHRNCTRMVMELTRMRALSMRRQLRWRRFGFISVCPICRSIPITHVDSSTSINPSDTPALQAAVTSTHIGFGAAYVLMLAFSFFVWSAWQGSYQEAVKAHWRRGIILGVMFIVTHTGVSVCERVRSSARSKDITASTFHFISPHGGRVRHRD
jgi:hypothetical protein